MPKELPHCGDRARQRDSTRPQLVPNLEDSVQKWTIDGEPSQLEKLVARAEEIYDIVRNSLNKSVYMQLQNIHNKEARATDCVEKSSIIEENGKKEQRNHQLKMDWSSNLKDADKEESLTKISNNRKAFVESIRVESKYLAPAPEPKKFQSLQRSNSLQGTLRLANCEQEINHEDLSTKKHDLSPFLGPMKKHYSKVNTNEPEQMLKKISENSNFDETPQKKKNLERSISRKETLLQESTEGMVRRISNPDLRTSDSSKSEREDSKRRKSKKLKELEVEYDELFFYYFENLLAQSLSKNMHQKGTKPRDRFMSSYE